MSNIPLTVCTVLPATYPITPAMSEWIKDQLTSGSFYMHNNKPNLKPSSNEMTIQICEGFKKLCIIQELAPGSSWPDSTWLVKPGQLVGWILALWRCVANMFPIRFSRVYTSIKIQIETENMTEACCLFCNMFLLDTEMYWLWCY